MPRGGVPSDPVVPAGGTQVSTSPPPQQGPSGAAETPAAPAPALVVHVAGPTSSCAAPEHVVQPLGTRPRQKVTSLLCTFTGLLLGVLVKLRPGSLRATDALPDGRRHRPPRTATGGQGPPPPSWGSRPRLGEGATVPPSEPPGPSVCCVSLRWLLQARGHRGPGAQTPREAEVRGDCGLGRVVGEGNARARVSGSLGFFLFVSEKTIQMNRPAGWGETRGTGCNLHDNYTSLVRRPETCPRPAPLFGAVPRFHDPVFPSGRLLQCAQTWECAPERWSPQQSVGFLLLLPRPRPAPPPACSGKAAPPHPCARPQGRRPLRASPVWPPRPLSRLPRSPRGGGAVGPRGLTQGVPSRPARLSWT